MSRLVDLLRTATVTDRAQARSGETLFRHPLASGFFALASPSPADAAMLAEQGWREAATAPAAGFSPLAGLQRLWPELTSTDPAGYADRLSPDTCAELVALQPEQDRGRMLRWLVARTQALGRRDLAQAVMASTAALPMSADHPWSTTAGQPTYLAAPDSTHAFLVTGSEHAGYTLLTLRSDIAGVQQRSAATLGELLRPDADWSEADWQSFGALLDAQPTSAETFWSLPAARDKGYARYHLLDVAGESFWHQQVQHKGLAVLLGDRHFSLRQRFADAPPAPWLDHLASDLNLGMDDRASFNAMVDAWMTLRASDTEVRDWIVPLLREQNAAFATWSDERLLALWRGCFNASIAHTKGVFARTRQLHEQASTLDAPSLRAVLGAHYGEPVIEALERAGKLTLLDSASELPASIRAAHGAQLSLIAGATTRERDIYLIANRISAAKAPGLFLHEVGEHAALPAMLGPDYGRLVKNFQRLLRKGDSYATWAAMRVPHTTPREDVPSEQLAYLVERVANDAASRPGGEAGYALGQQCLSNLRTWLFRTPLCRWLDEIQALDDFTLSPVDLAALAREGVAFFAGEVDPQLRRDHTNEWARELDAQQVEHLYSSRPQDTIEALVAMSTRQRLAYLYALTATAAPHAGALLEHFADELAELAAGQHGAELAAIAGETFALGHALQQQHRARSQVDRMGFAVWMDNTASDDASRLLCLAPATEPAGGWQLIHYKRDLGAVNSDPFPSIDDALKLINPNSFMVRDQEAPGMVQAWAQLRTQDTQADATGLQHWFSGSQAADEQGKPLVLYHGTGADFTVFEGFTHWASVSPKLASEYALYRQDSAPSAAAQVLPVHIRATAPFDADLIEGRSVTVSTFFNAVAEQAKQAGRPLPDAEQARLLLNHVRGCASREESGPHYSKHDFWNKPHYVFGRDGADSVRQLFQLFGFDSIRFTEQGSLTYGVFAPTQIKSALANTGSFSLTDPDIRFAFAGQKARTAPMDTLVEARALLASGEDMETIRAATGWHQGVDELWRFEIDDSQARLYGVDPETGEPEQTSTNPAYVDWMDEAAQRENGIPLSQALHHPSLFAAYPLLRTVRLKIDNSLGRADAAYYPTNRGMAFSVIAIRDPYSIRGGTSGGTLSALMHEVQHAIQAEEGFSSGASPQDERLPTSHEILQGVNQDYGQRKAAIMESETYQQYIAERIAQFPVDERYREGRLGLYDYALKVASDEAWVKFVEPVEDERLAKVDQLLALTPHAGLEAREIAYRLAEGEAEARNVQSRLTLTGEQRRARSVQSTADAPAEFIMRWRGLEFSGAGVALSPDATAPEPVTGAKQTEGEAFGRWFGDSKIVDEQGKPLVVYHGTRQDFGIFDHTESDPTIRSLGGFHFTRDIKRAGGFASGDGANVMPVFLSIRNPYHLTQDEGREFARRFGKYGADRLREHFEAQGYDGLIAGDGHYVAFHPEQIKSAIGNNGHFNPNDPRIEFGEAQAPSQHAPRPVADTTADQTESEAFRQWFGDSKLVDEQGKPLVVYHGTNASFDSFDPKKIGVSFNSDKTGFFFSSDRDTASGYAEWVASGGRPEQNGVTGANVLPVFVNLRNPLTLQRFQEITNGLGLRQRHGRGVDALTRFFDEERDLLIRYAKQEKHDGILLEKDGIHLVVAFRPEQIKSALGNNGNFDPNDPRIQFGQARAASQHDPRPVAGPAAKQTESEAFGQWFGGSKVVDGQGKPLVVYHGTGADIEAFDPSRAGGNYLRGGRRGIFFTNRPIPAGVYAEQASAANFADESNPHFGTGTATVMPVFLSLQSPYVRKATGSPDKWFDSNQSKLYLAAEKAGADGIIVHGGNGFENRSIYVAFRPEQIKSAIGNIGRFDPNDPRIQFSLAASQPLTAWHGSQHDHNGFSLAHIGSGEGNQSFGWGLYFASNRDVAEWYRKALSGRDAWRQTDLGSLDGVHYPELDYTERLALQWLKAWGTAEAAIESAHSNGYDNEVPHVRVLCEIAAGQRVAKLNVGRLYQVELAPADDEFLDWDQPLHQQSDTVKAMLAAAGFAVDPLTERKRAVAQSSLSGEQLYKRLCAKPSKANPHGQGGARQASEYLHSLGVRGIRYLDGASRRERDGHSNFVLFSDADVSIAAKFSLAEPVSTTVIEDPLSDSRIVDDKGKPLMLYHGTRQVFDQFSADVSAPGSMGESLGFYFTDSPSVASEYADHDGHVVPVYLNIKNPLRIDARMINRDDMSALIGLDLSQVYGAPDRAEVYWFFKNGGAYDGRDEARVGSAVMAAVQAKGYDGVIFKERVNGELANVYMAFEPEQIISAIQHRATMAPTTSAGAARAQQEAALPVAEWLAGSKLVDAQGRPQVVYRGLGQAPSDDAQPAITWVTPDATYASQYARDNASTVLDGRRFYDTGATVLPLYARVRNSFDLGFRSTHEVVAYSDVLDRVESGVQAAYERDAISQPIAVTLMNEIDALRQQDVGAARKVHQWWRERADEIRSLLERAGYDAISSREGFDDRIQAYGIFRPEQLRSAIGHRAPAPDPRKQAFDRWFAKSQVIDATGKPQVMFHASYKDFSVFDRTHSSQFRPESADTIGSWFSDTPGAGGADMYAQGTGAAIYPVYLNIQRPKVYTTFRDFLQDMHSANGQPDQGGGLGSTQALRETLKAQGYDGIAFQRTENGALQQEIDELSASIDATHEEYRQAARAAREAGLEMTRTEGMPYQAKIDRLNARRQMLAKELAAFGGSTEFDNQYVWVAFEPEQIKSAIGNTGLYDPANPDIRFAFAGEGANTSADAMLAEARLLDEAQIPAADIYAATGCFKGVDGRWRYEIDDSQASLLESAWYTDSRPDEVLVEKMIGTLGDQVVTLNEHAARAVGYSERLVPGLLDHPALFQAYPQLAGIRVEILRSTAFEQAEDASYTPRHNLITVRVNPERGGDALGVLMHEVQHAIQLIEGFAKGGNPSQFDPAPEPTLAQRLEEIVMLDELAREHGVTPHYFAQHSDFKPELVSRVAEWEATGEWSSVVDMAHERLVSPQSRYRRLAGEVEARNVQARLGLSAEQRSAALPTATQDVAPDAVILWNGRECEAQLCVDQARAMVGEGPLENDALGAVRFRAWFGNSQVTNEEGAPLVVYHGTAADFSRFDARANRSVLNEQYQGDGFHFTPDPQVAARYADASRNHFFRKEDIFREVDRVIPPRVAAIFKDVVTLGFTAAWDQHSADACNQIIEQAVQAGIDINDLLDLAPYVEGSRGTHTGSGNELFDLFNGTRAYLSDEMRDVAVSLGLGAALPNPTVMPVFLRAEKVLRTDDPQAAKRAREDGYDGVYYFGPGTVEDVPEWIVFDPAQIKSAIGNNGAFDPANADIRFSLQPQHAGFDNWFAGSYVVDESGAPQVVYRGEHGPSDAVFNSRLGSLSFGSFETARLYATVPNDHRDVAEHPRVTPAYLAIKCPLTCNLDADPFIDFSVLSAALGEAQARAIALDLQDAIYETQAWLDLAAEGYTSLADALEHDRHSLSRLYVEAYRVFDDHAYVAQIRAAGFDGAIYGGSGANSGELEYRVLSPEQVQCGATLPLTVAPTNWQGSHARFHTQLNDAPLAMQRSAPSGPEVPGLLVSDRHIRFHLGLKGLDRENRFEGRALTPAHIGALINRDGTPRPLVQFLQAHRRALAAGADVERLVQQHTQALRTQLGEAEQHLDAALRNEPTALSATGYMTQVSELKSGLGWFITHADQFQHQRAGATPAMLAWQRPLTEQPADVMSALALAGIDGFYAVVAGEHRETFLSKAEAQLQVKVMARDGFQASLLEGAAAGPAPSGREVFEQLSELVGGAEAASQLLRSSGIAGVRFESGASTIFPAAGATPCADHSRDLAHMTHQAGNHELTVQQSLSKIPGYAMAGDIEQVRQRLAGTAQLARQAAEERIRTLSERDAWLRKAPSTNVTVCTKNKAALQQARQHLQQLHGWRSPSVHNCLPWNGEIPHGVLQKVQQILPLNREDRLTGQAAFLLIAGRLGSANKAAQALAKAGVIGAYSPSMTVAWDKATQVLAETIEERPGAAQLHLSTPEDAATAVPTTAHSAHDRDDQRPFRSIALG